MLTVCGLQRSLAFIKVKREVGNGVPYERRSTLGKPTEDLEIGSGKVCTYALKDLPVDLHGVLYCCRVPIYPGSIGATCD